MSDDPESTRRILILGIAGAGKSTLSIRLAERLGAPVFHLDNVANADGAGDPSALHAPLGEQPETRLRPRPLAERLEIVDRLAAAPHWVAEGGFVEWTGRLMTRADTIVWLDHVSMPGTMAGVLRRVRRSHARASSRHVGVARIVRPRAYARHAAETLVELWDIAGYFWRRDTAGVARDIEAGRWDRISRATVREALRPHAGKVLHVRSRDDLARLEHRVMIAPPAADQDQARTSA